MQRLDFINEQMQKEHHTEQTFDNVDQAMKQYYYITGKELDPLPPEPKLSDYYTPSPDQRNRELLFVVAGMAATGFFAYELIQNRIEAAILFLFSLKIGINYKGFWKGLPAVKKIAKEAKVSKKQVLDFLKKQAV